MLRRLEALGEKRIIIIMTVERLITITTIIFIVIPIVSAEKLWDAERHWAKSMQSVKELGLGMCQASQAPEEVHTEALMPAPALFVRVVVV